VATDLRVALESVVDPQLDLTLGDVGMVGDVATTRRGARVELLVPIVSWPTIDELRGRIVHAAGEAGVEGVDVEVVTMGEAGVRFVRAALRDRMGASGADSSRAGKDGHGHGATAAAAPPFLERGSATRVLGISSGKGGVGKSTVSVNLAIGLAALGHRVGVLDADVYGFSVPKMVAAAVEPVVLGDTVVPTFAHGVRWLSMGWFVSDDQPVIWRGPLLHKAITQFVTEAWWGEPDFLVVDMPPGTGDVALTLSEVVPSVEVYVVTTPQPAAQRVAQRSALAARKLRLAVRGVVENMSWFDADGARHELFGAGGGRALADELGVPLLGQLPFVVAIREGGDEGVPVTVAAPDGAAAEAFRSLATRIAAQGPARVYRQELRLG
jgi:ATP-binding protein involved in chromosome partitioning